MTEPQTTGGMTPEEELARRVAMADARLHYPGDLRGKIEGQVVGPGMLPERYTILSTDYDEARDLTTAHLGYATDAEVEAARR